MDERHVTWRQLEQRTGLDAGNLHAAAHGRRSVPSFEQLEWIAWALGKEPGCFFEYRVAAVIRWLGVHQPEADRLYRRLAA